MKAKQANDWRLELGLTQPGFARFVGGVHQRTVRRWLSGEDVIPQYVDRIYALWQMIPTTARAAALKLMIMEKHK